MKMDDLRTLAPEAGTAAAVFFATGPATVPAAVSATVPATGPAALAAAPAEVFQQLGALTRQLHDTLHQLGVMSGLQLAATGLPDVRSRLNYIVTKTAAAADKVLNSVDQAKAEHGLIAEKTRRLADALVADPVAAVANGALLAFVNEVEARTRRIDSHLTDIMLAQDFHDLTGQVMAKVVALASDLENSLVKLLVQVLPPDQRDKVDAAGLHGPVLRPAGRSDVVVSQVEVDDLLASLGF